MKHIGIAIALLALCFKTQASECIYDSPESVLDYYLEAIEEADSQAIVEIYWGIESFSVYGKQPLISYEIIKKETLSEDMQFDDWNGQVPLWAQKDSVQMEVLQLWENGLKGKFFYSFRKIEGRWYMVGHVGLE